MNKTLLREFIRVIIEGSKDASEAMSSGLALMINQRVAILYDPKILNEYLKFDNDGAYWSKETFDGVVGYINTKKPAEGQCWDAVEVKYSAADKGWGPLMYNIALSLAPSHTIISDRDTVSDKALGVWNYFMLKRGDIEKKPLDDIEDPKTPPKEDDCKVYGDKRSKPLNFAYRSHGSIVNVGALEKNHQNFINHMTKASQKTSAGQIESIIMLVATEFFKKKYNE